MDTDITVEEWNRKCGVISLSGRCTVWCGQFVVAAIERGVDFEADCSGVSWRFTATSDGVADFAAFADKVEGIIVEERGL